MRRLGLTVAQALLVCCLIQGETAASETKRLVVPGATSVQTKLRTGKVVIATVWTETARGRDATRKDYWGAEGEPPGTIVSRLSIAIGKDTLWVPFSAYGDLARPSELTIVAGGAGAEVGIRGSDAGGAYNAKLVVLHGMLYKRRVESAEFPQQAWEETVYSVVTDTYEEN